MAFELVGQAIGGNNLQGSIKFVVAPGTSSLFNRGGELTIQDMRVDHNTRTICATVIGANGHGTPQNVPSWNDSEATGNTTFPG